MSFMSGLALLFIALKLMGYVDWSWWLVTMPIYGVFFFAFGVALAHEIHSTGKRKY